MQWTSLRPRPRALLLAPLLLTSWLVLSPPNPVHAASPAHPASNLHVVGGPVAAEGAAVVITVDASHNLHLEGIAPDSGKILWSHPYSESVITPGVAPTAYAIGNNVIDIVPAAKPSSPLVNIDGINATTGAVAWNNPLKGVVISDQPIPCAEKKDLCVIGFNPDGSTTMVIFNPLNGAPILTVNGPFRAMDTDIYETAAKDPVIERLSAFGTFSWSKPLSTLMGSSGFDPNFGWDFNAYGGIEVGTVGAASAPTDHSLGLDAAKTIGVSLADGSVAWRQPGQFQCGGALQFETPPLLCLYHGTLTGKPNLKATIPSFKGLNVTLQGVNPATGAITWNLSVQNGAALATGKVELVDDSHFLVDLANGKTAILDASTGQTAPVPKQQVFWCTSISFFKVNESKSVNPQRQRVAGNTFFPCTANGRATTKLPISSPSTIGTTIDGIFLWASPHGLGSRVVGAAHGVA